MTKRIAIYLTSPATDIADSAFPDYAQMLQSLLAPYLDDYEFQHFMVAEGAFPKNPTEFDAAVITGSASNVTESTAWMEVLFEHIRLLDANRTKIFAVCFGHQAVAVALGGKVEFRDIVLGAPEVKILDQRGWMQPFASSLRLYGGNFQQVVSLPENVEVIASHPDCPVAMAAKGDHLLSVQFHPEFSSSYMHEYIDKISGKISADCAANGRQEIESGSDGELFGKWAAAFLKG